MSDFGVGPPPEFPPLPNDVRTPSERAFDAGRDVVGRVNALVEKQRFDVLALAWMVCVLAIALGQIYQALWLSQADGFEGTRDIWTKLQLLTQSGGTILIFGSVIGVALATLADGRLARPALWLATLGGVWAMITGFIGITVSFHSGSGLGAGSTMPAKLSEAVLFFGFAGMGMVVAMIAGRAAARA